MLPEVIFCGICKDTLDSYGAPAQNAYMYAVLHYLYFKTPLILEDWDPGYDLIFRFLEIKRLISSHEIEDGKKIAIIARGVNYSTDNNLDFCQICFHQDCLKK